jgi:exodeoxyribonuclease VII large subunit
MARKGALAHEPQRRLMAAEQAVDDREAELREAVRAWLEGETERCRDRGLRLERLHPVRQLGEVEHRLVLAAQRLRQGMRHRMEAVAETIKGKEESLRLLGPQSVLSRGFSYTLSAEGKVIRSAEDVREGDEILTHLERGVLRSVVKGG